MGERTRTRFDSWITIEGARTHNLKNISCAIPRGALTVVTGVSGSGKSSLAFDTLYAEGQRRYVESMSTYARQFLERMQRPDVDHISGIPPAIALEQQNRVRNARSTVGSVTEISDFLRLLFANVGEVHCPNCDALVMRDTAEQTAKTLLKKADGQRLVIVSPVSVGAKDAGAVLETLIRQGYRRMWLDGKVVDVDEIDDETARATKTWPVCIDRIRADVSTRPRLVEACEQAFSLGQGRAECYIENQIEPLRFHEGLICNACSAELKPPAPGLFSPSSPLGACPTCQGFGRSIGIDFDKVIPDTRKSLHEGAVQPFQMPSASECQDDMVKIAKKKKNIRLDIPWRDLSLDEQGWVLDGDANYKAGGWKKGQWYGVRGYFRYLESKKYKMHVRVLLSRYRGYDACPDCQGLKLRKEALAIFLHGDVDGKAVRKNIAGVEALPISKARQFLKTALASFSKTNKRKSERLFAEIESRLGYLDEVGLDYLTLDRQARTLSGGETQRIGLASALGSQLTETLYVLDEPSIGLHPRDTDRLLGVIDRLTDRGNTVVVVEHDPEVMRRAEHILDLGPGAGDRGGEALFAGSFADLVANRNSTTGRSLARRTITRFQPRQPMDKKDELWLRITGARAHNLKNVDVEFPVGKLSCVTGVSGSGKSTLIADVLFAQAERANGRPVDFVGPCDRVEGLEYFSDTVFVDQSPLGRSSRSNPATYLKAMDELRKFYAATDLAKRIGLTPGSFSFNVPADRGGGRCPVCEGQGTVTLEMHFLADVTVLCDACDGRRFTEKVLQVKWCDLSILQCLELTVDEAVVRFGSEKRLRQKLSPFQAVGLGYLRLGQSTSTLSGGEAQRVKLAAYLVESERAQLKPTLFLLDEPTTGLSLTDVATLLKTLHHLVAQGHTVIVIEHNLDLIAGSDWVVDLGPDGGERGGELVAKGTPAQLVRVARSLTGRALAELIGGASPKTVTARKTKGQTIARQL